MTALATRLREHQKQLDTLLGLLGRERLALGEGEIDGEALATIARDKQELLDTLAEGEQQRRATCTQLGCSNDPRGDEQAARQQGCLESWQHTRERAREAARINHFNGELIRVRMESNQQLLNQMHALTGKSLYGPDGQTRAGRARVSSQA